MKAALVTLKTTTETFDETFGTLQRACEQRGACGARSSPARFSKCSSRSVKSRCLEISLQLHRSWPSPLSKTVQWRYMTTVESPSPVTVRP